MIVLLLLLPLIWLIISIIVDLNVENKNKLLKILVPNPYIVLQIGVIWIILVLIYVWISFNHTTIHFTL